jgi:hypothetical protein
MEFGINNVLKFTIASLLLVAAVYLAISWWTSFKMVILGGIPWLIALVAVVFYMLSLER